MTRCEYGCSARDALKLAVDALIWASGASTFNSDGEAREGWERVARPATEAGLAALASPCSINLKSCCSGVLDWHGEHSASCPYRTQEEKLRKLLAWVLEAMHEHGERDPDEWMSEVTAQIGFALASSCRPGV